MLVAAAVFHSEQGYRIFRRGPSQTHPGNWEFPGGKVEPGESCEQALQREIEEELGVLVRVGTCLAIASNEKIELRAFQVEIQAGALELREHDAEVVETLGALCNYPMTDLDRQIVEQLKQ